MFHVTDSLMNDAALVAVCAVTVATLTHLFNPIRRALLPTPVRLLPAVSGRVSAGALPYFSSHEPMIRLKRLAWFASETYAPSNKRVVATQVEVEKGGAAL